MSIEGSIDTKALSERFDPFHDPYLADPYPFFAQAREATPVFYSPDLQYWVVTRYHDIRSIFQTPNCFRQPMRLIPSSPFVPMQARSCAKVAFAPS
jgi:cytochrome P450